MAESEKKWNKFQRLRVKPGKFSERAKKAESATVAHARKFIISRAHSARDVRRHIALWLLGMGALIGLATLQFFLFQSSYTTVTGAYGGTYAEAVQGEIHTLNPLFASTEGEQAAARLIFSSLLTYDSSGRLRGDLAQDFSTLDEGKRYRVTLKPAVLWHDGKRLTADDVIFTVNLLKDPATNIASGANWKGIEVKKVNNTTIDFVLSASYAPFLHALTFPVVPKHLLANVEVAKIRESQLSSHPVGTGPFSFKMTQRLQDENGRVVVHMNSNSKYYAGVPKVDRFQVHSYKDRASLYNALKSHSVNAVSNVSFADYNSLKDNSEYDTSIHSVNSGIFALFNTTLGALSDVRVRQALQAGTDVAKAIDTLPVDVPILDAPLLDSQAPLGGVNKPKYEVERAKKLLEEAGWKLEGTQRSKDGEPLMLKVAYIKNADYQSVVESLTKQWRELGVRIETQPVDVNDSTQNILSDILKPRDYDVLVHELNLGSDPDVYAYWHSSQATQKGLNFSNYNSGISDDTLSSARLRIEGNLRDAKYRAFVTQWYKDAPAIGLYQSQATYAHTKTSSSFDVDRQLVTSIDRFGDVTRWSTQQQTVYKTP